MPDHLKKKSGLWFFNRRVPKEFAALDPRQHIQQSTGIRVADDRRGAHAAKIAAHFNREIETYWRGLVDGKAAEAHRRYDAAKLRARKLGFSYMEADELARRPDVDLVERIEKLLESRSIDNEHDVAALLGGESPADTRLSGVVDLYEEMSRAEIAPMSDLQKRKWRTVKIAAIGHVIQVLGDRSLGSLTRADGLTLQDHWQDRIISDGIKADTANKNMERVAVMMRGIERRYRLPIGNIFTDLRIKAKFSGEDDSREPYDVEFIQRRLLATGALDGMNPEARRVVYLMIETGVRPSEAVNLSKNTIHLRAEIPHIEIIGEGRVLKGRYSHRVIPLVGVSLAAMQEQPDGFPRYFDKANQLSGAVNKFLSANGLRPSDNHSLYSLRHSFKDRLREAETPEELTDMLMGHTADKPRYGRGHSLELKLKHLQRIALIPPASV